MISPSALIRLIVKPRPATVRHPWGASVVNQDGLLHLDGGSVDNAAILRANATLGYVRDEEWITLTRESA